MSKIQWTNQTWNPIIGCTKISPGCKNCYAETMATRLSKIKTTEYYSSVVTNGKWNGKTFFVFDAIDKPLKRKKPTMYFVCSMSDLFHESIPFKLIDRVFAVMAACPQHTFQILTKRPEIMLQWFNHKDTSWKNEGMQGSERIRYYAYQNHGAKIEYDNGYYWPLKNVWIGVTAENQEQANKRIPILFDIPAAKRFVSAEPLLGQIDFNVADWLCADYPGKTMYSYLDWIIVGGESGPKARPMHPDWATNIQKQCEKANVPFFFKQWGELLPMCQAKYIRGLPSNIVSFQSPNNPDKKNWYYRVGKKKAGSLLDGKEYKQFPDAKNQK